MEAFRSTEGSVLERMLGQMALSDEDLTIIDRSKIKKASAHKKKDTQTTQSQNLHRHISPSPSQTSIIIRPSAVAAKPMGEWKNVAAKPTGVLAQSRACAYQARDEPPEKAQRRPTSAKTSSRRYAIVQKRPGTAGASRSTKSDPKKVHQNTHHLVSQKRVDEYRFKRLVVYAILRREIIEKLHTYVATLVRFREVIAGEMELAKDWIQFRDYMQGADGAHRNSAKVRVQEEAKHIWKEMQANKTSNKDPAAEAVWTMNKKAIHELVLAAHGSMGTRPKSQARFDELFGSCPQYLLDSLPRKLTGDQTIRVSMMLRQEHRLHPEGRHIDHRYKGQAQDSQDPSKRVTFDLVKMMVNHRDVEDAFFAAELFSRDLGAAQGESQGEPVCGRLRRHRNVLLSQAPITNIDGMSDSDNDTDDGNDDTPTHA